MKMATYMEIDSFTLKFKQLLSKGFQATLELESNNGRKCFKLRLVLNSLPTVSKKIKKKVEYNYLAVIHITLFITNYSCNNCIFFVFTCSENRIFFLVHCAIIV